MSRDVVSELYLRELRQPYHGRTREEVLMWLCQSLGFCGERDRDNSSVAVFRVLLEAALEDRGLTSSEIAERCGLSRGSVIHHINRFKKRGLVIHVGNRYMLRRTTLSATLQEIKKDTLKIIDDLTLVAEEIDRKFGLYGHHGQK